MFHSLVFFTMSTPLEPIFVAAMTLVKSFTDWSPQVSWFW
jgi:hypothetical protein